MSRENQKLKRKKRIRAKIRGTSKKPRLSVFRSNKSIYAQLIDDEKGQTLVFASEKEIGRKPKKGSQTKTEKARLVGEILGQKAVKKGIKQAVFDRGLYQYHGRIKALAEGARKGGLEI